MALAWESQSRLLRMRLALETHPKSHTNLPEGYSLETVCVRTTEGARGRERVTPTRESRSRPLRMQVILLAKVRVNGLVIPARYGCEGMPRQPRTRIPPFSFRTGQRP